MSEADFLATLPTAAAHRWELPSGRALGCSGCGATVTLPAGQASVECLFCGSAHVAVVAARRDLIQPWGLLPFALDQPAALERIRAWIRSRPFLPANLESDAWLEQPRPVYLPFWTFDVLVQLDWTGAGEDARATGMSGTLLGFGPGARNETTGGRLQIAGTHTEMFDDIFVPAGRHLAPEILGGVAGFDTTALIPYSPDYLASWPVEIYHISLADASIEAHARARAEAETRARHSSELRQVQGLTFRRGGVTVESFKLVLLPVWIGALELGGRRYPMAVNGQTGTAAGHLPRSGLGSLIGRMLS